MNYYRLYFLRNGHIRQFQEIHADDDGEAVQEASRFAGSAMLELWCGKRKVKAFQPAL